MRIVQSVLREVHTSSNVHTIMRYEHVSEVMVHKIMDTQDKESSYLYRRLDV